MRVHVLQHVPFEGLGSIRAWLEHQRAEVTWTRFFESPTLPSLTSIDLLIALGGPMSANDESTRPWIKDEKRFISEAVHRGVSVLGICLGAQLIASSLGARVYPGKHKEIGWFPVSACQHAPGTFEFPAATEAFHWHGETFDLPHGAIHLARSEACLHQAFQIGRHVIGLQFHLETTPESADTIITNCRHELLEDRFVQTEQAIRSAPHRKYATINSLMTSVLVYITQSHGD